MDTIYTAKYLRECLDRANERIKKFGMTDEGYPYAFGLLEGLLGGLIIEREYKESLDNNREK